MSKKNQNLACTILTPFRTGLFLQQGSSDLSGGTSQKNFLYEFMDCQQETY